MAEFVMPILGADMTAGTLIAWRVRPGDAVRRGDILAEVETDKGLIDVEAFVSGVVEKLLVGAGATVPTGTVLALIREEAGVPAMAPPARLKISPLARRLAGELGVDLTTVTGTAAAGAITSEDVARAAAARPGAAAPRGAAPARGRVDLARMRQTIGTAMARSKREIPHYYLATTIDLARALAWLAEENSRRPVIERLLLGVLFIKAVALALGEVPELNAVWKGDRPARSAAVHVGVAVSLRQGGLVAPALHDADRRGLGDLMRGFRDLVQRARTGGLRSSELSDPTITVTSLGDQGVETVFGIVYPPQVAIVGFGRVVERPWVVEGRVIPRPLVTATLSADHRVSDGHRGGRFLAALDRLLQQPERLG
ncbi:MAG: 2-oxo acid dehydrogenase subunit E2 [Candidatus Rokubacteria bacterium]|nr:2-oxo acid dehydrogenase subunit E2 [Candidatus Rokubacteria bacterium]